MKNAIRNRDIIRIGWVLTVFALVLSAFSIAQAATAAITTELDPGDSGAEVTALQTFLASDATIYPEGLVTGYYGDLTVAAVQRYQCREGIVCQGSVSTTGYGRVGPSTLARMRGQQGTPSNNGSDVFAPVIGMPTVATSSTSASISWATNEPARSRVMYSTVWPFLYASAQSMTDTTFDTSGNVALTGLAPNTRYYYVLESVDASGNLQWGIDHSFVTTP